MSLAPRRAAPALALLLAGLALGGWGRCATPVTRSYPTGPWVLVWEDAFDGLAGQSPDGTRWAYDVGGGGWGNNQLEYDTARITNVSLDGAGHLAITARQESYGGRSYTSARVKTQGLYQTTYGRIEASIKLPFGRGIRPAFWMLGADIATAGWPACGEIDVMENFGWSALTAQGALHGPGYSGGAAIKQETSLPGQARFDADFHLFAVNWDPGRIQWELDGTIYQTVYGDGVPGTWVFDQPFFIILNVAVGGNPVAPLDASTTFPQTMLVDFVRVYERGP